MKKLESFALSDNGKVALLVSGALTGLFEGVESFVLIPKMSKEAGGLPFFDNTFKNPPEQMRQFVETLSEEGKDLYRKAYMKSDNIYPLIYSTFFTLFFIRTNGKADWKAALPYVLIAFDYTENLCTAKMVRDGTVTTKFARFAGAVTKTKMITLLATINLLLVDLVKSRKD